MLKFTKTFLIYVLFLIMIGYKREIIISLIFVLIHEFTHYFVARTLGFNSYCMKILPFGAVLNLENIDEAEPYEDLIISIAGPLMNIVLAIIFYFIYYKFKKQIYYVFFVTNLVLGIFNLIPAFPLDGARVLRDILSMKTLYKRANKITLNISIFIGIFMCFIYFLCFFKGIENINLGLISLLIIITSLKERERVSYIIMGDLIKKRNKLMRKGYLENKSVSIFYKSTLLKALELVDKNKYNLFLILNENMQVVCSIYEEDIIEGLKIYGNITLEEYIKKET